MTDRHVACQIFWILKVGFVPPFSAHADYHAFKTLMVVLNHVPLVQLSYPVEGAYSYPVEGANNVPWEFLYE